MNKQMVRICRKEELCTHSIIIIFKVAIYVVIHRGTENTSISQSVSSLFSRACITKDPFYDLVSARKKKIINHTEHQD